MEKQLPCNHKHGMWQKQDSGPQKTNFQCLDSLLVCELLNGDMWQWTKIGNTDTDISFLAPTHVSYLPHHGNPPRGTGKSYLGANAIYACTADWQQGWDLPQTQDIAICVLFPFLFPHVLAPTGFYIYLSLF